ncbi:MAG: protein phosphatase 2C domain-containing protein [Acidobacteriota bacterium]|jgi:protein phosphatase|nr:protein phosphatase 2C domain-containing protein [Acidobacteriota bacterium]
MSRQSLDQLWDGSFLYSYGQGQHQGRRAYQEDFFGLDEPGMEEEIQSRGLLFVLADGMGGSSKGDTASVMAVENMMRFYRDQPPGNIPSALSVSLEKTNEAIFRKGLEDRRYWKMGTTCLSVVLRRGKIYFASVGDSHLYLVRDGHLQRLTDDHSIGAELDEKARSGDITTDEAKAAAGRSKLTSFLGDRQIRRVHVSRDGMTLRKNDRLVLCSDGLYGFLSPEDIRATVTKLPARLAAGALIEKTMGLGFEDQDNITVQVIEVMGPATKAQAQRILRMKQQARSKVPKRDQKRGIPMWAAAAAAFGFLGILFAAYLFISSGSSAVPAKKSAPDFYVQTAEKLRVLFDDADGFSGEDDVDPSPVTDEEIREILEGLIRQIRVDAMPEGLESAIKEKALSEDDQKRVLAIWSEMKADTTSSEEQTDENEKMPETSGNGSVTGETDAGNGKTVKKEGVVPQSQKETEGGNR